MAMSKTDMLLRGYGLTTAGFFYHVPDDAHVPETFVWQECDTAPDHLRLFGASRSGQRKSTAPCSPAGLSTAN